MKLMSPKGTEIVATLEVVYGTCGILNSSLKEHAPGVFDFEFDGTGTNVNWDSQETVVRKGADSGVLERIFVDEDGTEFLESSLKLVEEES